MSKVVTIPKDRNPFVVIVNGVKHSYPAGVTTEVPDEVADVIEKYEGAKPKPDPNAGSGVSWNDLKDKPFGDSPTGGDTLYWDGNTEGLACWGVVFFKISDLTPTIEELSNGYSLTLLSPDGEMTVTEASQPVIENDGAIWVAGEFCIIFPEDKNEEDFVIEKGLYFASVDGMYTQSLTIPGYTGFPGVKKIDIKYLPIEELKVALGIGG